MVQGPAIPSCNSRVFRVGSGVIFLLDRIDFSPGDPENGYELCERATISPRIQVLSMLLLTTPLRWGPSRASDTLRAEQVHRPCG
jgi:hypothetical protein